MSLREKLEKHVQDIGFKVNTPSENPPPGMDWVLDIIIETPQTRIIVRAAGNEKQKRVVLAMPIGFSEAHYTLIMQLPLQERTALLARMLREILLVCPYCRVGLAGSPDNPRGVVGEIHYVEGLPDKQRLSDDIARLLAVYMIVNTILWEKFPGTAAPAQTSPQLYT